MPSERPCQLAVLLCVLAQPLAAQAQRDPVALARRLCQEAEELHTRGEQQLALSRYERAYALVPTPVILLGKAVIYRDLHQPGAGLAALRQVDAEVLPPAKRRELALLRQELVAQLVEPPLVQAQVAAPPTSRHATRYDPIPMRSTPNSHRPPVRPLRIAGWLLGAAGLMAAIAGTALWAVDGRPTCQMSPGQLECPRVLDTRDAGIALLASGAAAMGASAVIIGIDYRRGPAEHHSVMLTLAGKL